MPYEIVMCLSIGKVNAEREDGVIEWLSYRIFILVMTCRMISAGTVDPAVEPCLNSW